MSSKSSSVTILDRNMTISKNSESSILIQQTHTEINSSSSSNAINKNENSDNKSIYSEQTYKNSFNKSNYSLYLFENIDAIHIENNSPKDLIKEMSNHKLIIVGMEPEIYIYKKKESQINKIKFENSKIFNIQEKIINNAKAFLISTNEKIYSVNLSDESKEGNLLENKDGKKYNFIFNIINDDYVICQEDEVFILKYTNMKTNKNNSLKIIGKIYYREGIIINKNLFVLTSNKIISKGKNIITFYDIPKKRPKDFTENSCIVSSTGLYVMTIRFNNGEVNKVLLCACKKYLKNQKNGIKLFSKRLHLFLKIIFIP